MYTVSARSNWLHDVVLTVFSISSKRNKVIGQKELDVDAFLNSGKSLSLSISCGSITFSCAKTYFLGLLFVCRQKTILMLSKTFWGNSI